MTILERFARPFVVFVERYYPDPFVFAILLTLVALLMAVGLTSAGPIEAVTAWGDGLPGLLAFIAQLSITLLAAHALAHTDAVQRFLSRLGNVPRTPFQAYSLVCATAAFCHLIAWSLGLVAGALMARQVARSAAERGLHIHYPLLVASAYAGIVVWHMGYSGSAPLFVATPGHAMEADIGLIPVTQTILAWQNIVLALVTIAVISFVCPLMAPARDKTLEAPRAVLEKEPEETIDIPLQPTFAATLDQARVINVALAILLAVYLVYWFGNRGLELNLNIVNWTFLCAGLALARSPVHYVQLISNASRTIGQIILQYPFYAGIMGVMAGTGLGSVISGWFVAISTPQTLPFWAFLCAGVVNMFIPSGGGQWAVQGPIFIEAAKTLDVSARDIVLAISYGDQWTNTIQPFWTIPLLAIAGLTMREIMGYTFVIFFVTFVLFSAGLLFLL